MIEIEVVDIAYDLVLVQRVAATGLLHPAHYSFTPVSAGDTTRLCYRSGRHYAEGFRVHNTAMAKARELANKVGAELREVYDIVDVDSPGLGHTFCREA